MIIGTKKQQQLEKIAELSETGKRNNVRLGERGGAEVRSSITSKIKIYLKKTLINA